MVKPMQDPPTPQARLPRDLRNIAETTALARVYAAAYQGHAAAMISRDGEAAPKYGDVRELQEIAAGAVRHFCAVIREAADG